MSGLYEKIYKAETSCDWMAAETRKQHGLILKQPDGLLPSPGEMLGQASEKLHDSG